jgi:two-component system sensor histidine kinase VicK
MPDDQAASFEHPAATPQVEALEQESRQLLAQQAAAAAQQHEQSQARFRTVFENSPLGQKIITPAPVIR